MMTPSFRYRCAHAALTTLVLFAVMTGLPTLAQEKDPMRLPPPRVEKGKTTGVVWTGEPGITETVAEIMQREAGLPIGALRLREKRQHVFPQEKRVNPEAPAISQWPLANKSTRVPF